MKFSPRIIIYCLFLLSIFWTLKSSSVKYKNTDTKMGRISNIMNRNNTLIFDSHGVNRFKVSVYWSGSIIKRPVFKNGDQKSKIGYKYGENYFKIVIDQNTILTAGHFKKNNWHSHKYVIDVTKDTIGFTLDFIAEGPDFSHYSQQFDFNGTPNGLRLDYNNQGKIIRQIEFKNGEQE